MKPCQKRRNIGGIEMMEKKMKKQMMSSEGDLPKTPKKMEELGKEAHKGLDKVM